MSVKPGCWCQLGAQCRDPGGRPTNHSAVALFDDSVLAEGIVLYAELSLRRLAKG
jgi:hypothetical protein